MTASKSSAYLVQSLVRASEILLAFRDDDECLRLRDVTERTRLSKGVCFRLLFTLRHCGFVERVEKNQYRLTGQVGRKKEHRIEYGAHAADGEQVELIIVDNRYQPKLALKDTELLIPTAWTSSLNSRPTKGSHWRLRRSTAKRASR